MSHSCRKRIAGALLVPGLAITSCSAEIPATATVGPSTSAAPTPESIAPTPDYDQTGKEKYLKNPERNAHLGSIAEDFGKLVLKLGAGPDKRLRLIDISCLDTAVIGADFFSQPPKLVSQGYAPKIGNQCTSSYLDASDQTFFRADIATTVTADGSMDPAHISLAGFNGVPPVNEPAGYNGILVLNDGVWQGQASQGSESVYSDVAANPDEVAAHDTAVADFFMRATDYLQK